MWGFRRNVPKEASNHWPKQCSSLPLLRSSRWVKLRDVWNLEGGFCSTSLQVTSPWTQELAAGRSGLLWKGTVAKHSSTFKELTFPMQSPLDPTSGCALAWVLNLSLSLVWAPCPPSTHGTERVVVYYSRFGCVQPLGLKAGCGGLHTTVPGCWEGRGLHALHWHYWESNHCTKNYMYV